MPRGGSPAGRPITWLLAALLAVGLGAVITRSSLLWGPTRFEHTRDMGQTAFAQTYQAARMLYAPPDDGKRPVVILGNSRIWLTARPSYVEPELARVAPGVPVRLDNLAVFGAGVGDLEVLSRHLDRLDPALVIVALAASDVLGTAANPLENVPARLLQIGWADGPIPPATPLARLDRWARTAWPLYRFREMARAALADRVAPDPPAAPFPAHFPSTHALFEFMHGAKADEVERAYRAWRAQPTLDGFVDYLGIGSAPYLDLVTRRTTEELMPAPDGLGARTLDVLLARLAAGPWRTVVLLLPVNPLLARDTAERFHRPAVEDAAIALITTTAARHDVPVVDARAWMPAEAFLDFDHLLPDLGGFQVPLAKEIAGALGT